MTTILSELYLKFIQIYLENQRVFGKIELKYVGSCDFLAFSLLETFEPVI